MLYICDPFPALPGGELFPADSADDGTPGVQYNWIVPRNERKNARFERTRFAPSPTGFLHPGHLRNALWTWGAAKAFGAKVLFRLEDHDGGCVLYEKREQVEQLMNT